MSTATEPPRPPPPAELRVSLSQFAAQVLGQLRLTAWLPGATVVGGLFLAIMLRLASGDSAPGSDGLLKQLVSQMRSTTFETIVLLVLGTAVVTTATQSFSFGMIRLLEGYWGSSPLIRPAVVVGVWFERRRRQRLQSRLRRLKRRAVELVDEAKAPSPAYARAIVAVTMGEPTEGFSEDAIAYALDIDWHAKAPPRLLRPMEDAQYRLDEFPLSESKIMPTRVGNVMRRAEIEAFKAEPKMEMAVARVFDKLPPSLQVQHDQARGQLDLYGLLVAAALMLSFVGGIILWDTQLAWWWIFGMLSWALVNQRAMIASARNYAAVLTEIPLYVVSPPSRDTERTKDSED